MPSATRRVVVDVEAHEVLQRLAVVGRWRWRRAPRPWRWCRRRRCARVSPADSVTAQPLDAASGWAPTAHDGGTGLVCRGRGWSASYSVAVGQVDGHGGGAERRPPRWWRWCPGRRARRRWRTFVPSAVVATRWTTPSAGAAQAVAGGRGGGEAEGAGRRLHLGGCARRRRSQRRRGQHDDEQGAGGAHGGGERDAGAARMRRPRGRPGSGRRSQRPARPSRPARTDAARPGPPGAGADGTRTARRPTSRSAPRRRSLLTDPRHVAARPSGARALARCRSGAATMSFCATDTAWRRSRRGGQRHVARTDSVAAAGRRDLRVVRAAGLRGGRAVLAAPCATTPRVAPGWPTSTYEAYEEQVVPRLDAIAAEIRRRWPTVGRIALLHRTGRLALGDVVGGGRRVGAPSRRGLRGGPVRHRHAEGDRCRSGSRSRGPAARTGRLGAQLGRREVR